jgi:diadenosine tetraphosphate (Ap4A) HIT family hydrolase
MVLSHLPDAGEALRRSMSAELPNTMGRPRMRGAREAKMVDWRTDRVGAAERGENPTVLMRMQSGFAVIGDSQLLPGYCLLLASPRVATLNELDPKARRTFLFDMSLLGEALESVQRSEGLRRINYEILGNTDAYLHTHVFPRYDWESAPYRDGPVWLYPRDSWSANPLSDVHADLRRAITSTLGELMAREGILPRGTKPSSGHIR